MSGQTSSENSQPNSGILRRGWRRWPEEIKTLRRLPNDVDRVVQQINELSLVQHRAPFASTVSFTLVDAAPAERDYGKQVSPHASNR